ncbi:MAG: hypothetical protein FWG70_06505 [Oscillospiraceae bacterium]|nr:hypothetical protein [Oscillospiraceae bacterium]
MGLSKSGVEFFAHLRENEGFDFTKTITLGRQNIFGEFLKLNKSFDRFILKTLKIDKIQLDTFKEELQSAKARNFPGCLYAEPFFKVLGAKAVDSIDYSDYEEATIIHDLSVPIPTELKNKYNCVIDGGLLEHVFNYPVALKNAMDLVSLPSGGGGGLVLITPGNNWFGHGFYQFSPELFYSVLREENGFTNTKVYTYSSETRNWYYIKSPREVHGRVDVLPKLKLCLLYVVSEKIGEVPSDLNVYQSDYEAVWEKGNIISIISNKNKLYKILKIFLPKQIKNYLLYKIKVKKYFIPVKF